MNDLANDPQEMLQLLRQNYVANLPGKLNQIEIIWQDLQQAGWKIEIVQKLHMMVHKLAGSGASYGFPTLSEVARNLEVYMEGSLEDQAPPDAEWQSKLGQMLANLKQAMLDSNT